RLRREPRTCGCGVTARAHIHVRTRYRGHPWPLPRHTRTSTSSACLCLPTCRSRSCRRPRRGVVYRDAAVCIAVAGKAGSYTNECSAHVGDGMRGLRKPLPSQTKVVPSTYRWTSPGRGDGASGTGTCHGPECAHGCAPEGCTIPTAGRRPRPEPHTSGALAHAPEGCTIP